LDLDHFFFFFFLSFFPSFQFDFLSPEKEKNNFFLHFYFGSSPNCGSRILL